MKLLMEVTVNFKQVNGFAFRSGRRDLGIVDELIDGIWKEVAYRLPAGETAVLQTSWKTLFGELPPGKYRIIKKVYVEAADRTDIHYLAAEFEINKNN